MKHSLTLMTVAVAAGLFSNILTAQAETLTFVGPTSQWNLVANWDTGTSFPNGVGAAAILTNIQTANRVVELGQASITIGSLSINNAGGNTATVPANFTNAIGINNSATQTLTFNANGIVGDATPATITVTGAFNGAAGNPNGIRGPVILNDDLVVSVETPTNGDRSRTMLAFLQGTMTGSGGFTMNGPGRVSFADAPKAFTGPLVVNGGVLRMNLNALVPSGTPSVFVASGAQIQIDGGAGIGLGRTLTFGPDNNTVVTLNGLGLPNPPLVSGGPFHIPGAIRVGNGLDETITNPIVIDTDPGVNDVGINILHNYNFTTNVLNSEGFLRLTNTISGDGRFVVNPHSGSPLQAGTIIFSADNTYSGGTLVQNGTLVVSPGSDLGTGNVTVDGDSIVVANQGSSLASGRMTIQTGVANAIANSATLTLTGDTALFGGVIDGVVGGFTTLETGINEVIGALVLGPPTSPIAQPTGTTHGSTTSVAARKSDAYFTGSGIVTIGLAGDFNGNGTVDAADYALWRDGLGTTYIQADYDTWTANFGSTGPGSGSGFGAVPEPASALLLLLALATLGWMRGKRRCGA